MQCTVTPVYRLMMLSVTTNSVWVFTSWVGMDRAVYCDTCTQVNDVISNHKQCLGVHVMGRYGPCDVL